MQDQEDKKEILEAVQDIAHAVQALASHMDEQFRAVRAEMATKDFVDRRIGSAVEEIAPTIRKVDEKDSALVRHLADEKMIGKNAAATITALSPFPNI